MAAACSRLAPLGRRTRVSCRSCESCRAPAWLSQTGTRSHADQPNARPGPSLRGGHSFVSHQARPGAGQVFASVKGSSSLRLVPSRPPSRPVTNQLRRSGDFDAWPACSVEGRRPDWPAPSQASPWSDSIPEDSSTLLSDTGQAQSMASRCRMRNRIIGPLWYMTSGIDFTSLNPQHTSSGLLSDTAEPAAPALPLHSGDHGRQDVFVPVPARVAHVVRAVFTFRLGSAVLGFEVRTREVHGRLLSRLNPPGSPPDASQLTEPGGG
jgi:hypothetical protein